MRKSKQKQGRIADCRKAGAAPSQILQLNVIGGELSVTRQDRSYQVRGIPKKAYSRLRVAIHIARTNGGHYRDTLDLLSARNREHFAKRAAGKLELELQTIESDLVSILDAIETYQQQPEEQKAAEPEMTPAEKAEALPS